MQLKPPELVDPLQNDAEEEVDRSLEHARARMSFNEDRWLYWVRVFFILVLSIMTIGVIFIFLWHLLTPQYWRWLDPAEVEGIKGLAVTIIVGLAMSAVTSIFFRKKP
jgi:pilus assembly protein TadC